MKIWKYMKDGGEESHVWGFFVVEIKGLFSIAILKFEDGSREAFHSHAFNAISWVLSGRLLEFRKKSETVIDQTIFGPSLKPIITTRDNMHKVVSQGTTRVITFRGPWANSWREYIPSLKKYVTLTHGRKVVAEESNDQVAVTSRN